MSPRRYTSLAPDLTALAAPGGAVLLGQVLNALLVCPQENHQAALVYMKDLHELFKYKYVFMPIHDDDHWSLAIVCHPGAIFVPPACNVRSVAAMLGAAISCNVTQHTRQYRLCMQIRSTR